MSKNNERVYQWTSTFKSLGETEDGGINIKGYENKFFKKSSSIARLLCIKNYI